MRRITPTARPLPFEQYLGGPTDDLGAPAGFAEMALSGPAVAQYNDLVHELHPDAPHVNQRRLQQLAAWLLDLPEEQARTELDARLQRLEELRALLDDPAWRCHEAVRMRIGQLLAYADREDDLIPDGLPLLGRLDDALLVELAWPAFAAEADAYRAFRDYGTPAGQREASAREPDLEGRDTNSGGNAPTAAAPPGPRCG